VIDIEKHGLIFQNDTKQTQKTFVPSVVRHFAVHGSHGVLCAGPLHQIVNVLEVIVKGHTTDTAVIGDVLNGNFVQWLG
jgi:hypothetical protein